MPFCMKKVNIGPCNRVNNTATFGDRGPPGILHWDEPKPMEGHPKLAVAISKVGVVLVITVTESMLVCVLRSCVRHMDPTRWDESKDNAM